MTAISDKECYTDAINRRLKLTAEFIQGLFAAHYQRYAQAVTSNQVTRYGQREALLVEVFSNKALNNTRSANPS